MSENGDIEILRELAMRVAEIANKDIQDQRRDLWREHNGLRKTRPPVIVRVFCCLHELIDPYLQCQDPFFRGHERFLRRMLLHDYIGDDTIVEPWIYQPASYVLPEGGHWGMEPKHVRTHDKGGAYQLDPPIKDFKDVDKLARPRHVIDEGQTARNIARIRGAIGDILEISTPRSPHWTGLPADISYDLGQLRGFEQIMWDMVDHPKWLHELLAFMRDSILALYDAVEDAGDWRLCDSRNQAMTYAQDLPDPRANSGPVKRQDLWIFMAAQELAGVSAKMHDEFMLQYQIPIMKKFGLAAYGCCEDLTNKIDILRKIPNLRRIAITPWADAESCAEQIGEEYVCSWRPNPAEMVCCGFDPDRIRRAVKAACEGFARNGCIFEICLKDVETVQNEPQRLPQFVSIVREVSAAY